MKTKKKVPGVSKLDLAKLHDALTEDRMNSLSPRTSRAPSRATPKYLPPLQKSGSNLGSTQSLNKHEVLPRRDGRCSDSGANMPQSPQIQGVASQVTLPGGLQRTRTLYLSRANTKAPLQGTSGQEDGEDEQDGLSNLPAFSRPPPNLGLTRDFTFTGYDIMADVAPPTPDWNRSKRNPHISTYQEVCRQLNVIPTSFIENRLLKKEIRMRSYGLGAMGAKALAITLVKNEHVNHLDISDNNVGAEGALAIAQMLTANTTLSELYIADNDMAYIGGSAICMAVREKHNFTKLNLGGNQLRSDDGIYIADMIENNFYLRELILSHNVLEDDGATAIGNALVQNDTLAVLDLSWNCIRGDSAVAIANGLARNNGLKLLNLSWNGFGRAGCEALSSALTKNSTLLELDLRCNRIYMADVAILLKGLEDNSTLTTFKLGLNPITPEGAMLIIQKMKKMQDSPIKDIDLTDIVVTAEFLQILKEVQEKRTLRVRHGISIRHSSSPVMGRENAIFDMDPRAIVFQMMEEEKLRVVDLFNRLDEDSSFSLTRSEFKEGILSIGLPITEHQLDEIVDIMDTNGDGTVDLGEMIAAERLYKRTQLKRKMKKAAEIELNLENPQVDPSESPRSPALPESESTQ